MSILRLIGSVFASLLLAFVLVILVELFSSVVHPLPPNFGNTMEEMCQHVARYPDWVLAVVIPMWGGTAFVSTWLARRIGNRGCGLAVGTLLYAAVLFNISMLPYPKWFKAAMVAVIPVAVLSGLRRRSEASVPA